MTARHGRLLPQEVLEPFLYEYTAERGGSISAEHGLGQMKNRYMGCAVGLHELALLQITTSSVDTAYAEAAFAVVQSMQVVQFLQPHLHVCRFSKPQAAIDIMRQIKQVFDPNGIMNPYKLLPPT